LKKRQWIIGGLIVMSAIAAPSLYFLTLPKSTALPVSGRIEGYETDIGAKIPGRVNFVAVREGDTVKRGQVIAKLDDAELQAQLGGATSKLSAAQQQVQQAQLNVSVIGNQIAQAQMNLQQSQGDTQGKVAEGESLVETAQAFLKQEQARVEEARALLEQTRVDRDRYAKLAAQGAETQQRYDVAKTAFNTAQAALNSRLAAVDAASRAVKIAQGKLTQAQTTTLNPGISESRVESLQKQLEIARSQLKAAQAEVKAAQAARQQIQAQLAYLKVVSPIDGVVMSRNVEPGAVVGSGRTLLTVMNPNSVYLRGYIPEGEIGKVKVGQTAKIWLDSNPKQPLTARVSAIDTEASFTPENVYFKKDRVEQVFGVKLAIDQPNGLAKPGMPADGEIATQ
jgi:HlyD family secretion protein